MEFWPRAGGTPSPSQGEGRDGGRAGERAHTVNSIGAPPPRLSPSKGEREERWGQFVTEHVAEFVNRGAQPTCRRALANILSHGEASCSRHSRGDHDICTERNTRSGCGIMIVKRPSGVVTPASPCGEPFGLAG